MMVSLSFAPLALIAVTFSSIQTTYAAAGFGNWAQFCNGLGGTGTCSKTNYDLNNPGCFSVASDVKSVKFHSNKLNNGDTYSLIYSPQPGCNCQDFKQTVYVNGDGSLNLDTSKGHASFRWISGSGDSNNC